MYWVVVSLSILAFDMLSCGKDATQLPLPRLCYQEAQADGTTKYTGTDMMACVLACINWQATKQKDTTAGMRALSSNPA